MCLAIPGKVVKLKKGNKALVDFLDEEKEIDVSLIEDLKINDWIIAKQTLAINKIDGKEAKEILKLVRSCHHQHKGEE